MLRPRRAVNIFLVLLAFGYGGWLRASVTVAEVDARLKNRLPAGVHHTRVAAVLDSLKVERSEYDQEARKIYAVWRRTRVELFSEYGIEGRFSFDDRGALVDYELEETFTAW